MSWALTAENDATQRAPQRAARKRPLIMSTAPVGGRPIEAFVRCDPAACRSPPRTLELLPKVLDQRPDVADPPPVKCYANPSLNCRTLYAARPTADSQIPCRAKAWNRPPLVLSRSPVDKKAAETAPTRRPSVNRHRR